jgi:hypothetical protein
MCWPYRRMACCKHGVLCHAKCLVHLLSMYFTCKFLGKIYLKITCSFQALVILYFIKNKKFIFRSPKIQKNAFKYIYMSSMYEQFALKSAQERQRKMSFLNLFRASIFWFCVAYNTTNYLAKLCWYVETYVCIHVKKMELQNTIFDFVKYQNYLSSGNQNTSLPAAFILDWETFGFAASFVNQ